MNKPNSLELRDRICAHVAEGNSARWAARVSGVSAAKAVRLAAEHRDHGTAAPKPHRPVFIDETALKTNLTRLRGRAPVGKRLHGAAPFDKWDTQTFIAGLTQDALIAPWMIKWTMDGAALYTYIETQLAPGADSGGRSTT